MIDLWRHLEQTNDKSAFKEWVGRMPNGGDMQLVLDGEDKDGTPCLSMRVGFYEHVLIIRIANQEAAKEAWNEPPLEDTRPEKVSAHVLLSLDAINHLLLNIRVTARDLRMRKEYGSLREWASRLVHDSVVTLSKTRGKPVVLKAVNKRLKTVEIGPVLNPSEVIRKMREHAVTIAKRKLVMPVKVSKKRLSECSKTDTQLKSLFKPKRSITVPNIAAVFIAKADKPVFGSDILALFIRSEDCLYFRSWIAANPPHALYRFERARVIPEYRRKFHIRAEYNGQSISIPVVNTREVEEIFHGYARQCKDAPEPKSEIISPDPDRFKTLLQLRKYLSFTGWNVGTIKDAQCYTRGDFEIIPSWNDKDGPWDALAIVDSRRKVDILTIESDISATLLVAILGTLF